jgi:hypothetical protein
MFLKSVAVLSEDCDYEPLSKAVSSVWQKHRHPTEHPLSSLAGSGATPKAASTSVPIKSFDLH